MALDLRPLTFDDLFVDQREKRHAVIAACTLFTDLTLQDDDDDEAEARGWPN